MGKFLVTGASGFLGANFALIAALDHEVWASSHTRTFGQPGIRTVDADLREVEEVDRLVDRAGPEWVIHCAAATNVDWCQSHSQEASDLNVRMTGSLASAAQRNGASVVYISTDSVFDGQRGGYTEEDVPAPCNVYAKTKLEGEKAALEACEKVLVLRTNFFGWSASGRSLAEWVLGKLRLGEKVPGFEDVRFTPILVNDLVDLILTLALSNASGLYHAGGDRSLTKFEFARDLARRFGFDPSLVHASTIESAGMEAPRPRDTSLDSSKLGCVPDIGSPSYSEGVSRFAELGDSSHTSDLSAFVRREYA